MSKVGQPRPDSDDDLKTPKEEGYLDLKNTVLEKVRKGLQSTFTEKERRLYLELIDDEARDSKIH